MSFFKPRKINCLGNQKNIFNIMERTDRNSICGGGTSSLNEAYYTRELALQTRELKTYELRIKTKKILEDITDEIFRSASKGDFELIYESSAIGSSEEIREYIMSILKCEGYKVEYIVVDGSEFIEPTRDIPGLYIIW